MSPEDKRIRAANAEQLLANEMLVEALDRMEREAVDALGAAPLWDSQVLQQHAARLQAVRAFRDDLRSIVTNGTTTRREPTAVA